VSSTKLARKNWRIKRSAMPTWYKQRHGVRARALSGAARVAKHRPRPVR
jgi:sec-independent protein translocase protein TatB